MADQVALRRSQPISLTTRRSKQAINILIVLATLLAVAGSAAIGLTSYGLPIVVGFLAAVVAVTILLRPEFGLYLLIAFVFTNLSDVLTLTFNLPSTNKPLVALIFVGTLANRIVLHRKPIIFRTTEFVVMVYGVVVLLSLLGSSNQVEAQKQLADWVKDYAILLIIVQLAGDEKVWKRMQWTLILSATVLALLSCYQVLTGDYSRTFYGLANAPVHQVTTGFDNQRVTGPLDDPNFYAMIMLMVLPMAAYQMLARRTWLRRIFGTISSLAILATVIFTYSRGAFLAMVIVGILILRDRRYNPYKIGLLVLVLTAILSPVIPPRFIDRISTLTDILPGDSLSSLQTQTEVSFRGRSSEAIVATQMFSDYPILGVGHGNYKNLYLEYSSRLGLDARLENRQAHSLYLEVIAETGIVGIITFLIMLAVLFLDLRHTKRLLNELRRPSLITWVNGIQYGFTAYLLSSFFLHGDYIRYFWLIVGFVLASSVMAEELYRRQTETKTAALSVSVASNFE